MRDSAITMPPTRMRVTAAAIQGRVSRPANGASPGATASGDTWMTAAARSGVGGAIAVGVAVAGGGSVGVSVATGFRSGVASGDCWNDGTAGHRSALNAAGAALASTAGVALAKNNHVHNTNKKLRRMVRQTRAGVDLFSDINRFTGSFGCGQYPRSQ